MATTITINVTRNDIREARKKKQWVCPIEKALTRLLPIEKLHRCFVLGNRINFYPWKLADEKPTEVNLPEAVQSFLIRFDERKQVKPIKFKLEIP